MNVAVEWLGDACDALIALHAKRSHASVMRYREKNPGAPLVVYPLIRLGQRVKGFAVEAFVDGNWKEIGRGTTIGYKRILRFPGVRATKVRLNITDRLKALAEEGQLNATPSVTVVPGATAQAESQIGSVAIEVE